MKKNNKLKIAQFVFAFFLLVFLIVIVLKFSDLAKFVQIISGGIWYYIALLFILEIIYLVTQSESYMGLYKIFGKSGNFLDTFNVFLAMNFVNLALPFAGFSGVVTFIGYAKSVGLNHTQALIINFLYYISVFVSFVLLVPLMFLFPDELASLGSREKYIILIFSLLVLPLAFLSLWMLKSEKNSKKIVTIVSNISNKISNLITRKNIISSERIDNSLIEFSALSTVIKNKFKLFIGPFAYCFIGHVMHFLIIYFAFFAFGSAVNPFVALIGYIISVVFIVVSVTPSGIGIVEPLMILFFTANGISVELAAIVTFIFRGVVFWLPFFGGFLSIRKIHYDK